jgi:acyl-coenzyme A thioesterase PaaI-like protein
VYTFSETGNETEGDCSTTVETSCFACGRENPVGLHITYRVVEPGSVRADWHPSSEYTGFDGVIHGGVVTTALDEAMAKAIVSTDTKGLTCELKMRFRHSVHPETDLSVRGWIVERKRRLIKTEATVCDRCGRELAHAWAVFLVENGARPHHAW